jgi:hypothetical protein
MSLPAIPTQPTGYPDWSTTLANDPVTGQPNRAEPSAGKKITGFNFNEKPPRQDTNWLNWTLGLWTRFFKISIDRPTYGRSPSWDSNLAYSQKVAKKNLVVPYHSNPAIGSILLGGWDSQSDLIAESVARVTAAMRVNGSTDQLVCDGVISLYSGNIANIISTGGVQHRLGVVRTAHSSPSHANNGSTYSELYFAFAKESGANRADFYIVNNSGSDITLDGLFIDFTVVPINV